jgi:glycopeptide antibiotics resistance protein
MKNGKKIIRLVSWLVFVVYLVALVYFLFFSEQLGRKPSDSYQYSLVPLKEIRRYITYWRQIGSFYVLLNLLGNVICFVPFGFVLPVISKQQRNLFKITLLSFLSSLLVELIQLISKVGSCDVDDILLNTLGGVIGYLLFWGVYQAVILHGKRAVTGKKLSNKNLQDRQESR